MSINAWNRVSVAMHSVPGYADKIYGLDKAGLVYGFSAAGDPRGSPPYAHKVIIIIHIHVHLQDTEAKSASSDNH